MELTFLWLLEYWYKYLGLTLMSPNNLLTYKSCCFLMSALISCLSSWNLHLSLLLPVVFAFAWVLFLFLNLHSNLRCNPRDGSYQSTCLRGNILIYSLLNEEGYQIEVFLNRTRTRMNIEIFFLCKVWRIHHIESKSPFWYKWYFHRHWLRNKTFHRRLSAIVKLEMQRTHWNFRRI